MLLHPPLRPRALLHLPPADELRNNRQKVCSPPDFVQDPAKAGLKLQQYCTEVRWGGGRKGCDALKRQEHAQLMCP